MIKRKRFKKGKEYPITKNQYYYMLKLVREATIFNVELDFDFRDIKMLSKNEAIEIISKLKSDIFLQQEILFQNF